MADNSPTEQDRQVAHRLPTPLGTIVDISAALSADLAELGQDLSPSGVDLEDVVRSLRRDARLAVRSLLGLTLTVVVGTEPVTLTSIDEWVEPSDIRSSLQIMLPSVASRDVVAVMTFYAEVPDAFEQLATDLSRELTARQYISPATEGVSIRMDHTVPTTFISGLTGVAELSTVNQAVGVLIAQGHTHNSALDYLNERTAPGADLHDVALEVLRGARTSGVSRH